MIYLASVIGMISNACIMIVVFAIIVSLLLILLYLADCVNPDNMPRYLRKIFKIILIAFLGSIFIPSEITIYKILAVKYAKELSLSPTGEKVYKLINKKLDEALEEK